MNFKEDKLAADSAVQREANLATYRNWLPKHPEVKDCIANLKMFQEYLDWSDEFTEADLEFALGNMTSRLQLAIQRVPTPEETKAALIDKICSLIASANGGRDGKFDSFNLDSERGKMAHWTIPQLTQRLEEIVRKQTLAVKPIGELQKIVVEGRKYVGYPALGKTVVPPGKVRAVPQDAAYLRALDPWELKKLVRLYGLEQVNNRLAGKD